MWVGCLSTLRPLFRKIFSLGSLGSSGASKVGGRSGSAFPSNARRTYDQFSSHRDVEMGNMGNSSNAFKTSIQSTSHPSDARASLSSDSDSVEQILKEAGKQGMGGGKGIVVSRQVQIQRS